MKKYTIYANCQGQALARVLNSSQSFTKEYEYVKLKRVQNIQPHELESVIDKVIPDVDLFIYQPISRSYKNNPKYSASAMVSLLNSDSIHISFPSCYFLGYHPELRFIKVHTSKNSKNVTSLLRVNGKQEKSLVHDANIISGYLANQSSYQIKKTILDDDFYDKSFIAKNLDRTFLALKEREETFKVNIPISQYVKDNFQEKKLFYTFNHPSKILMQYIAVQILELIDIKPDFQMIPNVLAHLDFPIYPSIHKNLGLQFPNISEFRLKQQSMDLELVISQYLESYRDIPIEVLENSIQDWSFNF